MPRSPLLKILSICCTVLSLAGGAHGAPKTLEARIAALEVLVNDLQAQLAAERAARIAADQALQAAITAEVGARSAGDQALQTAIANEATARAAADQSLQTAIANEATTRAAADQALQTAIASEATTRAAADQSLQAAIDDAAAVITAAESFTSRVPSTLNNLSLAGGIQVQYTDEALGQNTDAGVFSMQSDGTLKILKAGSVAISASLRFLVNTGSVASSNASLSILINGFPRASASAVISNVGEDTLHQTLNWKVNAGDAITLRASSSNNISPAVLICCNDSTLSVEWIGIK